MSETKKQSRDLARKVLKTEAAAILGLVDRKAKVAQHRGVHDAVVLIVLDDENGLRSVRRL